VNFFGFDGKWCMCNVNGGMQKDIMEDFGWRRHIDFFGEKNVEVKWPCFFFGCWLVCVVWNVDEMNVH
jgi:hypothetical protein